LKFKAARAGLEDLATPHASDVGEMLRTADVSPPSGLSSAEAIERLRHFGPNELRHRRPASLLSLFLKQFASPVVLLLVAAALLAALFGQIPEAIAVTVVLIINSAIGLVTEARAVRSMEALRELTLPNTHVRRDGRESLVPSEDLVPGDIVIVEAGDVISADMRVIQSANLAADESALTGESLPVGKQVQPVSSEAPLAERASMLFKGCSVTRGTGEAVVTATGMTSELGHITHLVEQSLPERSPLERQLDVLSRQLIWLTLALAAAIAISGIIAGKDIFLMVEAAIALAVAAIPEGLPVVATLALARGMLRMAKQNAVMERLSAVETLGSTTVIMTDKTGTLTENRMHVERLVTAAGQWHFDPHKMTFVFDSRQRAFGSDRLIHELLRTVALCNNASLEVKGDKGVGDPMEVALLEAAAAAGLHRPALLAACPEIEEHAFDASTRMMSTMHRTSNGYLSAVKGAPEAVFDCIHDVFRESGIEPFEGVARDHWSSVCDEMARKGLRLLAVASKQSEEKSADPYRDLTLIGVVGFHDPPRSDIAGSIADARRAGIEVVMVTGDHPATALHIAEWIGLASSPGAALSGRDLKPLDQMSDVERETALAARVFSRVSPEQKLNLITLHQRNGQVVAMTGDGVNDAPALRKADIGIAMGLRGTQVAKEAADMVLRDDAFATIIYAIREGRIIFTNIRRFTIYLLSCNLSEILVVGLAVLAGLQLPLLPLQILFLNLVTDVFPALALGTVEADSDVLSRPPRPPSEAIVAQRHWRAIVGHGLLIAATTLASMFIGLRLLGLPGEAATTMSFFTLALAQLWHVFNMRNWREGLLRNQLTRNPIIWLAILLCLVLLLVAALEPNLAAALSIAPLPAAAWQVVLLTSLVPVVAREVSAVATRLRRRGRSKSSF